MPETDPIFPSLPAEFGRYRVLKMLGKGGMGAVYIADDTKFRSRKVALKIPLQKLTGDAAARFQREADAAAILHHPNICTTHDVGTHGGLHFLAMQFVEGQPLSDLVGRGKLWDENAAIDVVVKLAGALQYAHDKGVIHRDIKPLNVMMLPGDEPILMDFGLAKLAGDPTLTAANAVLGSPYYMPIEQARGQHAKIGPQSDLYSLGVLTFEMLTGERPFTGTTTVEILTQILTGSVPPLSKYRPGIRPQLEEVLLKATAKARKNRHGSMRAFAEALAGCKQLAAVTIYLPSSGELSPSRPVTLEVEPPAIAGPSAPSVRPPVPDDTPPQALTVRFPRRSRRRSFGSVAFGLLLLVSTVCGLLSLKPTSSSAPATPPVPAGGPATIPKQTPPEIGETVEEFEWKGEKRTRTVIALNLGGEVVEFVKIPAGSFAMGSPDSDPDAVTDEKPQHTVTFTQPRWMAKYPVTKAQFAAFVKSVTYKTEAEGDGEGGYGFNEITGNMEGRRRQYTWENTGWKQTDQHPVVNVTFNDAVAYCTWASKQANVSVRLPGEAEYEYANRAGSKGRYFTGDDAASLEEYANVADRSFKVKFPTGTIIDFDDGEPFTSRVGIYKPNGFGLFDMSGNVWSWCADMYDEKLYQRGNVTDPSVPENGSNRVNRGGSWKYAVGFRSALRVWCHPLYRDSNMGFRCVLDPSQSQ